MSEMAAGWYHAEGDPPGSVRYWDGSLWRGEPQAPVGAQPAPPVGAPSAAPPQSVIGEPILPPTFGNPPAAPYGQPPMQYQQAYPESSNAVGALLVTLLGFFFCSGLTAPIGWKMAHDEIVAIDAGRRDPKDRSLAVAAKIISIVITALMALVIVAFVALIVVGFVSAAA